MDKSETVEAVETQNDGAEVETRDVETEVKENQSEKTESPEARVARLKRELRRAQQKAGIAEEEAADAQYEPKNRSFKLGYEHKAYLNANGIKGKEEYALAEEYVQNTGKELEEVVDSKFFQAELSEMRSLRDSKLASDAASGSKRGQQSARDTVEYWLAKGDDILPPPYMTKLRREVVNARIAKYNNPSPFLN